MSDLHENSELQQQDPVTPDLVNLFQGMMQRQADMEKSLMKLTDMIMQVQSNPDTQQRNKVDIVNSAKEKSTLLFRGMSLKPLLTNEDFGNALATSKDARRYLIPQGKSLSEQEKEFQKDYYPTGTTQFIVQEADIDRPLDKTQFIDRFKSQLDNIQEKPSIEYVKLSKEIKTFHKFPPSEAMKTVFTTIFSDIDLVNCADMVGSVLMILLIVQNSGLDPNCEDHVNALRFSMDTFGEVIHVNKYFTILVDLEPLLVQFMKKKLGWEHCPGIASNDDFKTMYGKFQRMSYTPYDPAFNFVNIDVKKQGKYFYADSISTLATNLNADVYNKFKLDPSIALRKDKYVIEKYEQIYFSGLSQIKTVCASRDVNIAPGMRKLTIATKLLSDNFHRCYEQRQALSRIIVVMLLKDFSRDTHFEKQVAKISNRLNDRMLAHRDEIPLDAFRQLIDEYVDGEEFRPTKDYALMKNTVIKHIGVPVDNVPLVLAQNQQGLTLNSALIKPNLCKRCQIMHDSTMTCIPYPKNIQSWKRFKVDTHMVTNITNSSNSPEVVTKFLSRVLERVKKASLSSMPVE
ncbi:hypothetical protein QEN19_002241 [Hanseniaspora menglaensis]